LVDPVDTPYVGPRTFEEKDSRFFFGREREARELLSLVISEPLVLFYAQSGAGKSSLINTRLVPGLRQEGFEILPIGRLSGKLPVGIAEVGNIFVFNLLLSLDQSQAEAERLTHTSLRDYLETLKRTTPEDEGYAAPARVLLIDQFEEIFTAHLDRWQERKDFFRQLRQAMHRDPLLWVVLTLREDYVAALDPYGHALPGKLRARFHMQRMGYQAALEAVRKPAEENDRPFAPGVAEALVDNLRRVHIHSQAKPHLGEFVEPVQLQVVCYQLWENLKARPSAQITHHDLQELGDVDTALAQFYEGAIASVLSETSQSEIELRTWFERQLITESGTRGTVYQGEEKTGGLANRTVQLLASQFLLRAEIRAGGTWYELVHDRFIEPILQANQVWRSGQSDLVQSALAWEESGRVEDNLCRGYRLQAALTRVSGQPLEPLVEDFLVASRKLNRALEEKEAARQRQLEQAQALAEAEHRRAEEQTQASRRLRRLAVALAAVFLLALVAGVLAWTQRQTAVAEARARATAQAQAEAEALARATAQALAEAGQVEAEAAQATAVAARARAEADRKAVERQSRTLLAQVLTDQAPRILAQTNDTELATLLTIEALRLNRVGQGDAQVEELVSNSLRGILATDFFNITLIGHQDRVNAVAFSPDGLMLATASGNPEFAAGSDDFTVRLWDLGDPALPPKILKGHTDRVNTLAFSPDMPEVPGGLILASGGDDRKIYIWDTRDLAAPSLVLDNQADRVNSVAFSPDGLMLAAAGDQAIRLWNLRDPSLPPTILAGHEDSVTSVAFSADGRTLASGSDDQSILLWDLRASSAEPIRLDGHQSSVRSVAFSPDGLRLASGGDDRRILVWDVRDPTASPISLEGHTNSVTSLAFSLDGRTLASGSVDLTVHLWDLADLTSVPQVLEGHREMVSSVAFDPDGRFLASGSHDRTIRLWRLGPTAALTLAGHTGWIRSVAYSPDGQFLASGSDDQTIRLWDMRNPSVPPKILEGHQDQVTSVAFSPDGLTLASAAGSADLTIRLWDVATSQPLGQPLTGHLNRINWLAFSPNTPAGRQILASGSDDNQVRLWDLSNPTESSIRLAGHSDGVKSVAFSPDGLVLASGSDDKTIRLWDVATGQPLGQPLTGHLAGVNSVAFSPDTPEGTGGLTLASGSDDKTVRLWNVRDPSAPPIVLTSLNAKVLSVAFSPDGLTLAAGGDDRRIRLWDLRDPTAPPALLTGHEDWVSSVAFSPDGMTLASGSFDQTVRLWVVQIDTLVDIACRQVHRNLTPTEWQNFLVDEHYHQTCPNWPVPPAAVGEGSE
jgi:WD40 repeat protein